MSEYYTPPDEVSRGVRARASHINDLRASVVNGFDSLPASLNEIAQEVISARGDKDSLLERIEEAEANTAEDVLACQDEVVNCKAEVELAKGYAETGEIALAEAMNATNVSAFDLNKDGGYLTGEMAYSTITGYSYRALQDQAEGFVQPLSSTAYWGRLNGGTSVNLPNFRYLTATT